MLLYHRIATGFDPLLLGVSPAHFAEHLEVVRRLGTPARLDAMLEQGGRQDSGRRPLVTVTFDDGYKDNLRAAAPLLEAQEVSAMVFVTTGPIGGGSELWWDAASRLVVRDEDVRAHPGWTIEASQDPTSSHAELRRLLRDLRGISDGERAGILEGLRAATDRGRPLQHPLLTADEVAELDRSPFVEVGAHTVTHPVLASLAPGAQLDEMRSSKSWLESVVGRPVTAFAYPYGTPLDYSRASVRAAREAGFVLACANVARPVGRRSPRLEVPRLVVRDWDGDELERRLRSLLPAAA